MTISMTLTNILEQQFCKMLHLIKKIDLVEIRRLGYEQISIARNTCSYSQTNSDDMRTLLERSTTKTHCFSTKNENVLNEINSCFNL